MTEKLQVYQCDLCGNLVEVFHVGGGPLSCCGQTMTLMDEKTADATTEKHVPLIEKVDGGYKVTVGSTLHPMLDEHWIQWIELIAGDRVYRQYLSAGDAPAAFFPVEADTVTAREFCNLHGHWKA